MDKSKCAKLLLAVLAGGVWAAAQQLSEREIQGQIRIATTTCRNAIDSGTLTSQISTLNGLLAKVPDHADLKKWQQNCSDELKKKQAEEDQLRDAAINDYKRGAYDDARTKFNQLATRKTKHVAEAQRNLRLIPAAGSPPAAPSSNQDYKDLETAKSHINVKNPAKAKPILERLASKGGTVAPEAASLLEKIRTDDQNQALMQRVIAAFNRRNYQEAQQLCQQIESSDPKFPQLGYWQGAIQKAMFGGDPARAGGEASTPATSSDTAVLNKAQALINQGNLEAARQALQQAEFSTPSVAVRNLLQQVKDSQDKAAKTAQVDQLMAEAQSLLGRKQYETAQRRLFRAQQLAPDRTDIKPLLNQAAAAMLKAGKTIDSAAADLQDGIRGFYSGEFEAARGKLDRYVNQKGKLTALAYFYLGAAASAEYLLEGEKDRDKERQAGEYFAKVQQSRGRFEPPRDWISPRIMAIYDRASSRP